MACQCSCGYTTHWSSHCTSFILEENHCKHIRAKITRELTQQHQAEIIKLKKQHEEQLTRLKTEHELELTQQLLANEHSMVTQMSDRIETQLRGVKRTIEDGAKIVDEQLNLMNRKLAEAALNTSSTTTLIAVPYVQTREIAHLFGLIQNEPVVTSVEDVNKFLNQLYDAPELECLKIKNQNSLAGIAFIRDVVLCLQAKATDKNVQQDLRDFVSECESSIQTIIRKMRQQQLTPRLEHQTQA